MKKPPLPDRCGRNRMQRSRGGAEAGGGGHMVARKRHPPCEL